MSPQNNPTLDLVIFRAPWFFRISAICVCILFGLIAAAGISMLALIFLLHRWPRPALDVVLGVPFVIAFTGLTSIRFGGIMIDLWREYSLSDDRILSRDWRGRIQSKTPWVELESCRFNNPMKLLALKFRNRRRPICLVNEDSSGNVSALIAAAGIIRRNSAVVIDRAPF